MNIVFIAHYFPPLNSSGARRINAFAKYLAGNGHHITVVTTRKTGRDGLLTEGVPPYLCLLELGHWGRLSPTKVDGNALALRSGPVQNRSLAGRMLLKIKRMVMKVAGQLIDHRLFFAMQFALPWLDQEVKKRLADADVIMSSCPPWPVHLAGWIIKRKYQKLWVADYRDQFSGNHILRGSDLSNTLEVGLERWLLRSADCVIAISDPMKEYYEQFHPNVVCIENGYDEGMFEKARVGIKVGNAKSTNDDFVIRYMGSITSDRIPEAFFQALADLNRNSLRPMVVEFYGESGLLQKALSGLVPEAVPFVRFCPQLPYMDAIHSILTADALFFIETSDFSSHSARGVLTTKLFEYLAARKPIVAEITPKALAARYIARSGLGVVVSEDVSEMREGLAALRAGAFHAKVNDEFIDSLSRRVKANELEHLLARLGAKSTRVQV
ncbi:MAG: glycosyltransferase [Polaromonas sp.]|uniref:glycosyltransferase n=1 Tax=Polaromonas sp. TaxID=1869339 RepID=UPI001844D57F|nr:glycosyltransferase [Polaromonas sp.]MBA3594802.1 glycosyltransferase [Polaromonas sp.]